MRILTLFSVLFETLPALSSYIYCRMPFDGYCPLHQATMLNVPIL